MKYRFIPACVMLTAGLVCCIMSIVQRWDVTYSLIALLIVLILFYILGQIAAQVIGKVIADHEAMVRQRKSGFVGKKNLLRKKQKKRRQNRKTTKIMKQKHCDGVSLSE